MTPLHFKIRSIRERHRLTQEYMAEQLGISPKSYNEWETGKTKIRTDRLEEIAKILKTTPEGIYTYQDDFNQSNTFKDCTNHNVGIIQIANIDALRELYDKLLASKDAQLIEKDKRIATLEEMIEVLKANQ